ncbi:RecQ family ATP-dependent DNA helicase [Bacillota bacterium]
MDQIAFIDAEIEQGTGRILDMGAVREDGSEFRRNSVPELTAFLKGAHYVCGHNIIRHDLKYLGRAIKDAGIVQVIDTLTLSPLLFPAKPYHALLKDDKLRTDDINNPLSDAIKARDLFYDEVAAFNELAPKQKEIYAGLLRNQREFAGFFCCLNSPVPQSQTPQNLNHLIKSAYNTKICSNKDLQPYIDNKPIELAYALALIQTEDRYSIMPPWVAKTYPFTEEILNTLRNTPCRDGCDYCRSALDIHEELRRYFGYESFRTFDGEPLQEKAVDAAVKTRSLLTVFPTGGGKSMTFQLPALMGGQNSRGLTVVISPLQSLMKDQVDNLEKAGIVDAVTINGQLDPIERSKSIERVRDGSASLLYISPESLRSSSVENLLLGRNVIRFVIDEAHCFSAWGQDFRIDYLFIGDFIKEYQEKKHKNESIPVSCFTATARKRVIEDICLYFKEKLGMELDLFISRKRRHNLSYAILNKDKDDEKYTAMREIIEAKNCPTIVYVSRTRNAVLIAARLTADGFPAKPYHGQMDNKEKAENQNQFIDGTIDIIVATSAFGMGVDKSDVGLIIHYNISDSLENYIQEAGRAGRDESLDADCYVLFSEKDVDKHLMMLNQTKLTIREIQQIWRGIKSLTKMRSGVTRTALEIAEAAGWEEQFRDLETKVVAAIAALEQAGYVKRGNNKSRVYADSILARNASEAIAKIKASSLFNENQQKYAILIIEKLISKRSRSYVYEDEGESRIDYIAEDLGITQKEVVETVLLMREGKILADHKDLTAFLGSGGRHRGVKNQLSYFCLLENHLLTLLYDEERSYNLKQIREDAEADLGREVEPSDLKRIFNLWKIDKQTTGSVQNHINRITVRRLIEPDKMRQEIAKRQEAASFILDYLIDLQAREKALTKDQNASEQNPDIGFSVNELKEAYNNGQIHMTFTQVSLKEIENALFYLEKINTLKLEGSLVVMYNPMYIERLESDGHKNYKKEDYRQLQEHYQNKIQQMHIVGKYATSMINDYQGALQFVDDYFQMEYKDFLNKYFPAKEDRDRISSTVTAGKFRELFGSLSTAQLNIIKDHSSPHIVVAAGPGSGKTKLLVHKLAALLYMEDVRPEQLLMLTFSRAAAIEFKKRLSHLIGRTADFVDIKTFHSYCFDLLGKVGSIEKSGEIIKDATKKILRGDTASDRITKTAMVIDEAQDMDQAEYEFVKAMIGHNEGMKVIAVGDDDQNIFEFRGSSSKHMESFVTEFEAGYYELLENYRSAVNIVEFSNAFAGFLSRRLKKNEIRPHRSDPGAVKVYQYKESDLISPLIEDAERNFPDGDIGILTEENDDAGLISGLLNHRGIPAKLIQSNDGFTLANLYELRYFAEQIGMEREPHAMSKKNWNEARKALTDKFKDSSALDLCNNLLDTFEVNNTGTRYKSDFDVYLRESELADFYSQRKGTITVSTVHKAKGREFDTVYLMLKKGVPASDEGRRKVYVALTRARGKLIIYCSGRFFQGFRIPGVEIVDIDQAYTAPDMHMVQLSFRDIYLNQAFTCQSSIEKLVSGTELSVDSKGCYDREGNMVLRFSKHFVNEISRLEAKGLMAASAIVRYIVYWKNDEADKEIKIILPDVYFQRQAPN